jgi:hypothetical protein
MPDGRQKARSLHRVDGCTTRFASAVRAELDLQAHRRGQALAQAFPPDAPIVIHPGLPKRTPINENSSIQSALTPSPAGA